MNNDDNSARMLLVSRESAALGPLWGVSRTNSWQLEIASTGLEALERLHTGPAPDLILLDLMPGDSDGLQTLRWLRRVRPELSVILLSEPDDDQQRAEAVRLGPQDCLLKPCQEEQLEKMLKRHLGVRSANHDVELTCDEIEQISDDLFFVAGSPAMRKVRARAELLAQANVPVLILGESGSGKEIVARLIHKLSVRSGFRFLKVNCAALPGELLESELFGYERSAVRTKPGKFELCHRGTILLNEIGEMPANLQTKLLHVLQDRQFSRVGGETTVEVDVRVLAATNVDVERALFEKKLREDLYYRLSAFTVQVPPLRQRKDEILLLLGHFMNQISKHYGFSPRMLSPAVLEACQHHTWPGNLRELENFVKRYLVMGDESLVVSELQSRANFFPNITAQNDFFGRHAAVAPLSSLKSLVRNAKGETEKNAITGALEQTHWNRKAAARLLRISYRALLYKIQEYQMSPPGTYSSHFAAGHGVKGNGKGS